MLTRQEVYDTLVKAAEDGTFPSINGTDTCQYFMEDEDNKVHKCAIGVFVPQNAPHKPEEILTYADQSNPFKDLFKEITGLTDDEASKLQYAHDQAAFESLKGKDFKSEFLKRINKLFPDVNHYQA